MKSKCLIVMLCLMGSAALAQKPSNFSGSWQFVPAKSSNVGMMGQMKITDTIVQTDSSLDITSHAFYMGKDDESRTHFDLTGKPAVNESPMGGPSETVSKWEGRKLVITWSGESAVAGGPKVLRKETRSLSPDGQTMTVESVRGSSTPIVMVYEKK